VGATRPRRGARGRSEQVAGSVDFLTLVLASAERVPTKTALVFGDTRVSYGDLVERTSRLAAGLRRIGVRGGDAVGIYLHDCRQWVETFLAASLLGAWPVPINFRYGTREVAHIARDSRLRALVCAPELAAAVDDRVLRELILVSVGRGTGVPYAALLEDPPQEWETTASPLDIHCVLYTSGTTGLPKGALCTHANTVTGHWTAAAHWGLSEADLFLVASPLCHRVGLGRLVNSLALGATLELLPRFDPDEVLRRLAESGTTVMSLVPTMARLLAVAAGSRRFPDAALRTLLLTGEALPESTRAAVMRLFPHARCFSYFASTECGLMSVLDPDHQLTHARSVGRPVTGVRVRLADEQGAWVPQGATGEICVRSGEPGSGSVFRSYAGTGGESGDLFLRGWFRTGDIGRFDPDGFLYVVDRRKDMVISGGLNIASKEVEEVLLSHPAVRDAAVVGAPDATYGEAVVAFVVPAASGTVSADELVAYCRARMAGYKKPRTIVFVDDLPRTPVGKVLKSELRRLAAGPAAGG
jgi:long-chain acyl-CoA synthetase